MMKNKYVINSIFPTPVYISQRDPLDSTEEKEIRKIIEKGMYFNYGNSSSKNSYIFDNKLKELKEFVEQHLKIYVEQVITAAGVNLYITQSWINVTKPGEFHHNHYHQNSIVSGVFYISTEEDDAITFTDPNDRIKSQIKFKGEDINDWNSPHWTYPFNNNDLALFPSWLEHCVSPNKKATKDRISISFNTFAKGLFGEKRDLTELIL